MTKKLPIILFFALIISGFKVSAQQEMSICAMAEKALITPDTKPGSCNVFRTMESIRYGNYAKKGLDMTIERHYVNGSVVINNRFNEKWKYTVRKMNGLVVSTGDITEGENKIAGLDFGAYLILCESEDGLSTLDQINIAPLKNITAVAGE